MEVANKILEINVFGFKVLIPSVINNISIGKMLCKTYDIIRPEEDQLKTSIWPGVSIKIISHPFCFSFFIFVAKSSICVQKRFKQVKIAPLGPRLYLS